MTARPEKRMTLSRENIWAKGDSADHAALRPEIEKNIKRIEKARAL